MRVVLAKTVLISLVVLLALTAAYADPSAGRFIFQGCRNDGSITLPNPNPPYAGQFICPDVLPDKPSQASYTGGELGKGWNELDLVPFRLTATTKDTAPTTYTVSIVADNLRADNQLGSIPGYDFISIPTVNPTLSDPSSNCSVSAGDITDYTPNGGPVTNQIYRDITITQTPGTTCVLDWYNRLALGSAANPGATLHALFSDQGAVQGHESDVPIIIGVGPGLAKTMNAVQNTDHIWTIANNPTAATISFPNTCESTAPQPLNISVTWNKGPADPYNITVTTTITASNPSSRPINVNVTDIIYAGSDQSTSIDSSSTPDGGVTVAANTANFTVLTHTITVANGTATSFNDVATGTFTDTVIGQPVPGSVTAVASADLGPGGSDYDNNATIQNVESLTGPAGWAYSVDGVSDPTGSFEGGYTLTTPTTGPVTWDSATQSGNGSVTFNKTIYIPAVPSQLSGSLSDISTLTGSDFAVTGFTATSSTTANISTDARVTLTIVKNVNHALASGSSTFTFHVKDANGDEIVTPAPTITFGPGDSTKSVDVPNLAPGSYTVSEDPAAGWITDSDQSVTISLPACSGSVTFNNKRQAQDLQVSKTATASYTRTFNWSIAKNVDKTTVKQVGGTATFNYTVDAAETGFTDSAFAVDGTITVTNPNDWEDFTGVSVADQIDNGGSCAVDTSNFNGTVPASGSVTLPYRCTFTSNPDSGTNTATASWDATALYTPDSSVSGSAGYAFGAPTTTADPTITVTDTFNGGTPTTLGTLTGATSTPYASATYTYSHTIAVPQWNCQAYTNTAKIVESGQSASQTVTICGPVKTGALTMGFWQNKNGQGMITSGASTAGVCNSGTWLRQFAPYQDLSAAATCSQTANYVYTLIKAANAGGATMNAMLKAQMLATSLDVYFSDPSLGGNRIGAPAPIGGVSIDLTKVCSMIDASGGSGSCSGSYMDVSGAFGGATHLTVLQMIAYSSSQSNVGGSMWYGNVKSVQQWAKNAYDAINNQVAFAW